MLSWFSSKPKKEIPSPSPLDVQRSKQIYQLNVHNQHVSEIQRDLEYRIKVFGDDGTVLSIFVTLPPRFPTVPPKIKVSPEVLHPWVDHSMNVFGSPSLNNFSVHSDLGKAVKEVVEEFKRNPPTFVNSTSYHMNNNHKNVVHVSAIASAPTPANTSSYHPYSSHTLGANVGDFSYSNNVQNLISYNPTEIHVTTPTANMDVSAQIPNFTLDFSHVFDGKTTEDLEAIVNDEEKLDEIVAQILQKKAMNEDIEKLANQNELLAKENLMKKPVLEEKKKVILEKYEILNELHNQFSSSSKKQNDFVSSFTKQGFQDRLQIAAAQIDEEAELIAEKFLAGKIKLEDFKKKFMKKKTLSYLRKAKDEKLQTLPFAPKS